MESNIAEPQPSETRLELLSGDYLITGEGNLLVDYILTFESGENRRERLLIPHRNGHPADSLFREGYADLSELTDAEIDDIFVGAHAPDGWQIRAADYVEQSRVTKPDRECLLEVLFDEGWPLFRIAQHFKLTKTETEEWLDELGLR